MNSPASEFSTTSTPLPSVAFITSSAKPSDRESNTCFTPSDFTYSRFAALPAVA